MNGFSKIGTLLVLAGYSYATALQDIQKEYLSNASWYLAGQLGIQGLQVSHSSLHVHNDSGYPAPYDLDNYSTGTSTLGPLFALQVGRRWALFEHNLTAFSLGLNYQHLFPSIVGGQVMEFSLPQFTNYNYKWRTASNLILATSKVNLSAYHRIAPYINLGIGLLFNNGDYSEGAFAGVTPRISPNYTSRSSGQFAYSLGIGVDYPCTENVILNIGYQYLNLGPHNSGNGRLTWATQYLRFGTAQSNAFVFGLTYLFK